jgi:hypothetical protein
VKDALKDLLEPKNLKGISAEEGISLSWDPVVPLSEDAPIVLYIVHSGVTEIGLSRIQSISGDKTTAIISNVPEGEIRIFSVSAIDANGRESPKSQFVSVQAENLHPVASPSPSLLPSTPKIRAIGIENAITLSWDQYITSPASSYEILYGIQSQTYTSRKNVSGTRTTETINDLIPGVAYFFSVIPKDALGNPLLDDLYGEASTTPLGKSFFTPIQGYIKKYPQWTSQVGPDLIIIAAITFLLAGYLFFIRGQRQIPKIRK